MGFMDKLKATATEFGERTKSAAEEAKLKAGELAQEHGHKVTDAVAKGTDFVDSKTHGKYTNITDKVDATTAKTVEQVAAAAPDAGPTVIAGEPPVVRDDAPTAAAPDVEDLSAAAGPEAASAPAPAPAASDDDLPPKAPFS